MSWFPAALLVALLSAGEAAMLKRFLGDLKPLHMAALPLFWILPMAFVALLVLPWPATGAQFWWTMAVLVPLNATALLLHFTAVNLSPISLTMPLLAFTPMFVILVAFVLLDETVTATGTLGIVVIVVGSYILNLDALRTGRLLAPFTALLRDRGARMMLVAAVLYAFCAVLGKKLVLLTNPAFAAALFWGLLSLATLAVLWATRHITPGALLHRPWRGLFVALVMAGHLVSHMYAVAMVQAAYMVSIKRLNGLFSVFFGIVLFGERGVRFRLAGSLVMFLGVLLLTLGG